MKLNHNIKQLLIRMKNRVRAIISEKLSQVFKRNNIYYELEATTNNVQNFSLQWNLPAEVENLKNKLNELNFDKQLVTNVAIKASKDKLLTKLELELVPQTYLASLLLTNQQQCTSNIATKNAAHTIVEFSSPNIAKPFHVGHLRSTIIGNVLGNVYSRTGNRVTKMNYLGDWGTQFGLLQVGVEMLGVTDEQMYTKPIETLYQAYVAANKAAKNDPQISEKARQRFTQLEIEGVTELSQQWQKYRKYTIAELERIYSRLGVHFDEYEWESQYSQEQIGEVLASLAQKSLLLEENDGRKIVEVDGRRVPIIKSDGTTLYLARDIAALVDRFRRYKFSNILYVVDNGQADHFNAVFKTTTDLMDELTLDRVKHVKFGRIHGMSSRSGNAVFLQDVLNDARDIMLEKQLKSETTKIDLSGNNVDGNKIADILGVSAVIVNDLKQRRQRDYNFDWNKALQVNGDTGIKLQYTHCRLHSLLENVAHINVADFVPSISYLAEIEAQNLIYELSRYEQVLGSTKAQLEACVLVNYLFGLCNVTSRALKRLNVKHETDTDKQKNRILLFSAAKSILKDGMDVLGLTPLTQM